MEDPFRAYTRFFRHLPRPSTVGMATALGFASGSEVPKLPTANGGSLTQLRYDVFHIEIGWVGALASRHGLRGLTLKSTPEEALDELPTEVTKARHDPSTMELIKQGIAAYLRGDVMPLASLRLDMEGAPPFFRAAWVACRKIPPGETRSYAWLASAAGSPRAFRAAGQAMARNRLSIVIPCHRVIASDGGLHGYSGGLDVKERLLELERWLRCSDQPLAIHKH